MKILVWLILCLIWGTTWLFIKIGLDDLPPVTFAYLRFLLAALVIGAVMRIGGLSFPRTRAHWRLLALTGVLQFSINYSLVFWSELYITSGLAAVLQATIPVFGLFLAKFHLPEEKLTALKVSALAIGLVGVAVIFYEQLRLESYMAFAGSVAIVVGAYAAAHASVLTKAKGSGLGPEGLVFGQMICGLPALIFVGLVFEGNPLGFSYSAKAITSVLYLSLVGTIAAFWLYYWLLRRVESTSAMTIALVTPLIAVIFGAVFLGESLRPQVMIGGLLILSGVGLIVFRKRMPGRAVRG
ncbi:MAG: EamA family transporter [Acidobacteriota bacterium]|nr:MAG: EamA family transporter [Acidobacteriota bacterium]